MMTRRDHYCGGPGCGLGAMLAAGLRAPSLLPSWLQTRGGQVIPTNSGRTAIALIAQIFELASGDEVLVPSYNCGTEIDAIISTGATPVPYRITRELSIDEADIELRITSRTRAVYVTHYFGRCHDLDNLAALCRQRGVKLIEDCAISLFSGLRSCDDKMQADAAIFSFPKWFAVPDGGALVLKDDHQGVETMLKPPSLPRVVRQCLPLLKSAALRGRVSGRILKRSGRNRKYDDATSLQVPAPSRPDMPHHYYFDHHVHLRRMSRITRGLLNRVQTGRLIETRQHNWEQLREGIRDIPAIQPLFNTLGEDECPLVLPLMVNNRNRWLSGLHTRRINAIGWWAGYNRDLSWDEFPESCALKDQVLALPVHQELGEFEIEHIVRSICEIAHFCEEAPANANRLVDVKPLVSEFPQSQRMSVRS